MSHNIYKIGDLGAGADGSIPFTVDDLSDVGTVAEGETLAYDDASGAFVGFALPSQNAALDFALFGQGGVSDYANSGGSVSPNATWGFYDPSPINYVSSYVTFNVNASSWLQSITLRPGKYEVTAQTHPRFSASGWFDFVLKDAGGSLLSPICRVGDVHVSDGRPSAIVQTLTVTETLDIFIKLYGWSGVHLTQSTVPSQRGVVLVRRLL
jgi:hypothetical protein